MADAPACPHLLPHLKIVLPVALALYVGIVVVLRSWLHRRRTGSSPIVLTFDDSAHGYIGRLFRILVVGFAVDVAVFAVGDDRYLHLAPIDWLEADPFRLAGLALLALSLPWIAIAQAQMGPSFRIGIDEKRETALVHRGLYLHSRNPIYVGMMATLLSLLLLLPNALTLLLAGVSFVLIQVQTRLEEEHLARLHGERYEEYRRRVRRWL